MHLDGRVFVNLGVLLLELLLGTQLVVYWSVQLVNVKMIMRRHKRLLRRCHIVEIRIHRMTVIVLRRRMAVIELLIRKPVHVRKEARVAVRNIGVKGADGHGLQRIVIVRRW